MPRLIVTGPDHLPHEYTVTSEMTLGRRPGNDIQIIEEKASRRHCRFSLQDGKVSVEDLGSSNGIRVNGDKVQTCVLKHGDVITIGAHSVVFQDESAELVPIPRLNEKTDSSPDGQRGSVLSAVGVPDIAPSPRKPTPEKGVARNGPSGRQIPVSDGGLPRGAVKAESSAQKAPSHAMALIATVAAAVLVGVVLVVSQRKDTPVATPQPQPKIEPQPLPPKPDPTVNQTTTIVALPPKPEPGGTKLPPQDQKPDPGDAANIEADWNKALAERDRAMASGNFLGARAALSSFLSAHPGGDFGQRAQKELADTKKLIEASLDLLLKDAQKAAAEKNYRQATQRCTRLVACDPGGKVGAEARAILTQIDAGTEPRCTEVTVSVAALVKAGQLDKAGELLEKALDELGGTKWAERISATQLQILMTRSFMKRLEAERARLAAEGTPPPVALPAKKVVGVLAGVTGLTLEVKSGVRSVPVPIGDLTPEDLQSVLKPLHLNENHVDLAYLWLLLENTAAAQAEVERGLLNPQQAGAAIRLVSVLPNQRNLHVYDFSKWQHQSDWEALTGSWSTQNDKYVLDTPDGGDTSLRPASIGGAFPAKNARIGFDFELVNPNAGSFFAFEFGTEEKMLSVIFSDKGVALHANLDGAVNVKDQWTPGATHVDLAISGDAASLTVNGKKVKPLEVPGLSLLKGTVTFRVRESACSIDNIILRNVE
jgi:tetratricopeptide (TPR) repeat protein